MDLKESIPLDLFGSTFRKYIESSGLVVPERTFLGGTNLIFKTSDDTTLHFRPYDFTLTPPQAVEQIVAVKLAIEYAIKVEGIQPHFNPNLLFNRNYFLLTARNEEGEYVANSDFLPEAASLQNSLFGGGRFAYMENQPPLFFGTEQEIAKSDFPGIVLVDNRGTAQPAASLEELLSRLEQTGITTSPHSPNL